jgi:hypothetical protein
LRNFVDYHMEVHHAGVGPPRRPSVKEYGAAERHNGADETGAGGATDFSEVGEDPCEEGPQSRGGGLTRGGARAQRH